MIYKNGDSMWIFLGLFVLIVGQFSRFLGRLPHKTSSTRAVGYEIYSQLGSTRLVGYLSFISNARSCSNNWLNNNLNYTYELTISVERCIIPE